MSTATWLVGDVHARLADLGDDTVDLVCTSPPFWRQRAYLPADHPAKQFEIGQEATPADYIDVLLRLTAEWRRVLAPHGSIAIELGDTMAGSGGAGGDYDPGGFREGQPKWPGSGNGTGWTNLNHGAKRRGGAVDAVLAKSHCGIPELYRIALIYGHNPLTGQPSPAGRWIVRNVVDWCRRNPTPGDDGDKYRRASSDIVVATLSPKRWWDGEAVREPGTMPAGENDGSRRKTFDSRGDEGAIPRDYSGTRPLYDWWDLASDPYPGAHYAVWPPEIARRLIAAMCPERVCRVCGEPSRRMLSPALNSLPAAGERHNEQVRRANGSDLNAWRAATGDVSTRRETLGWTSCDHADWRPGLVLDPFAGSGTTLAVATGHGRAAIGIDLDDRNTNLAADRVGMFLEVP